MMTIQQEITRLFVSWRLLQTHCIDLSRQIKTSILQQINFVGKLEEDDGTTMLFIAEKQQKSILIFL